MQSHINEQRSDSFVQSFYRDHEDAITLIGYDERKPDFIETPYGSNPDSVRYHTRKIDCCTFYVTGFIFHHPHGATVSGEFAEPITAAQCTLEEDGEEIDSMTFEDRLEKAIVAKLGCISGLREVNLI